MLVKQSFTTGMRSNNLAGGVKTARVITYYTRRNGNERA